MANPQFDAHQAWSYITAKVDQVARIAYWVASLVLLVMFCALTARMSGHPIPYLPTPDALPLLYLSGVAYLIRR